MAWFIEFAQHTQSPVLSPRPHKPDEILHIYSYVAQKGDLEESKFKVILYYIKSW